MNIISLSKRKIWEKKKKLEIEIEILINISINMLLKVAGYGKLLILLNNDKSKTIEE